MKSFLKIFLLILTIIAITGEAKSSAVTINSQHVTGHEHLDPFKIVNMNGRLFDPLIGRFFSPDPYVQLPDFSQNFNRYSYCLNNPLKFVDPSGELLWHPDGKGNLIADDGDNFNTLVIYLSTIYGNRDAISQGEWNNMEFQINNQISSTGSSDIAGMKLTSSSGAFDNLVGKFLVTKYDQDVNWGLPKLEKDRTCSSTSFNRVDLAVEFVYGKDILGAFGGGNPVYYSWMGHPRGGYPKWGSSIINFMTACMFT